MEAWSGGRAHLYAVAASVVGLAYGLSSVALMAGPAALTSYAGRDPLAGTITGLGLVAAAVVAVVAPPARGVRIPAALTAALWFLPVWVGWSDGPPVIRAGAEVLAPFLVAAAVHLVAGSDGWLGTSGGRVLVVAAYAEALAFSAVRALFRDPAQDGSCWANCVTNVFLLRPVPAALRVATGVDRWFAIVVGTLLVTASLVQLVRAGRPVGSGRRPVLLVGAAIVGVAVLGRAAWLSRSPETAADTGFRLLFWLLATGLLLVSSGPVLVAFRNLAQHRAVARVASDLAALPGAGELQALLARAVRDPGLTIAYWVPAAARFVDGRGRPVDEAAAARPDDGSTTLLRDGSPLARIRHRPEVAGAVAALGAGTQLAVDNERLRAARLSQADDIRRSRERIVEAGDAGRRAAERDLHDGAQQRLLALSYHLRLARTEAGRSGQPGTADLIGAALDQTLAVISELREVAHGIYPAELAQAGLGPALDWLVDYAPIPVTVVAALPGTIPVPVATTAYVVVKEAIEDAARRSATTVDVSVEGREDRLMISVLDDGTPFAPAPPFAPGIAADRVAALGGDVRRATGSLQVDIPCA